MNQPRQFMASQVTASLVIAGIAFVGLLGSIITVWVNLNLRINTIEIELQNEKKQANSLTVRVTQIEQLTNEVRTDFKIMDERQKNMNLKIEEILEILKKRYDGRTVSSGQNYSPDVAKN
jgi:uncharacterized membrane protein YhiD involved in acid resistance